VRRFPHLSLLLPLVLIACDPAEPSDVHLRLGAFDVTLDPDNAGFTAALADGGGGLYDVRIALGDGTQDIQFATGSYLFSNETYALIDVDNFDVDVRSDGARLTLRRGTVELGQAVLSTNEGRLSLALQIGEGWVEDTPRMRVSYRCLPDTAYMGLGSHAFETEHGGQAFPLWVSEPGIGKGESDDDEAVGFPLEGTRHASSYPVPFLLQTRHDANPALADVGVVVDTTARVELDLCATDAGRAVLTAWDDAPTLHLLAGDDPIDVVEQFSDLNGRMPLPPAWAFAPWITAIRGEDRVREAIETFRSRDIPTGVIWTEDWKGADLLPTGFRLSEEWFADGAFYPDLAGLDAELESQGIAWLGYFAPFLGRETVTVRDAIEADAPIRNPQGTEPYWFTGVRFSDVTMVDLSTNTGRRWAEGYLADLRDQGFEGWMADYAEWLPTDADLASGEDALFVHNDYPRWWQETNHAVLDPSQHVWFCRSGWLRTASTCPVVWMGDQRTSFDADDGLPSIVPMAIGLNLSGVPIVTHDVAGYQSVGNAPSDRELWYRWAALGAWSPILRTHHGSFKDDNHQWDQDADTLAVWKRLTTDHTATFPYRYGLAARAADRGTPMILPTFLVDASEPVDRKDAWMLGEALLVVPVLERGATSVDPALPAGTRWLDVHTGQLATGGPVEVPFPPGPDDRLIAVFQREGTVVPRLTTIPDTLRALPEEGGADGVVTLSDVDDERTLTVFGAGGTFTEADGTTYTVEGTPTAATTVTATLSSGGIEAGGATLVVDGDAERTYTVVVVP